MELYHQAKQIVNFSSSPKTFERIASVPADDAIMFEARLMDRTGSESFMESVYSRKSPVLIGFLNYTRKHIHACEAKWSLIMKLPHHRKGLTENSLSCSDNASLNGGSLISEEGLILLFRFLCQMNIADQFRNIPYGDHRLFPVYTEGDIMAQPSVKAMHECRRNIAECIVLPFAAAAIRCVFRLLRFRGKGGINRMPQKAERTIRPLKRHSEVPDGKNRGGSIVAEAVSG